MHMKCLSCATVFLWYAAASSTAEEWWRTASIYQIYPRSFKDSDGDGVGDLKGIEQNVRYFADIGVSAIWLSPIQKSPMADFGYDISDFKSVDALFGTMKDLISLARTVEQLGIKLLLDLVPNHTSDQHLWFQLSLNRTDPYTDFYVWDDGTLDPVTGNHTPPNNWLCVFDESAWEWSEERQQFYLHQFMIQQPDLNYRNPRVVQAMEDVIRFWLDIGVDGFRVDAPFALYESKNLSLNEPPIPGTSEKGFLGLNHIYTSNQNETFELLEQWGKLLYFYSILPGGKERVMLLECYTDLHTAMRYYGSGDTSLVMPFNFQLLRGVGPSARASTYKELVDDWMELLPAGDVANWVVGNHDVKRLATVCDPEMVDAINMLTCTLPGIKVTYYGEEIGMTDTDVRWDQTVDRSALSRGPDHYQEYSRDPQKTPMQWDDSESAGFSTNSTTWLPVNPNYWWLNVAAQRSAQASHLKVFQAMAKARKDPVMKYGDLTTLAPDDDTFIILRSYQQCTYLLIINLASYDSHFTTQSTFAPLHLDLDMEVVVSSTNVPHRVGDIVKGGSIILEMRPKAAILLKSPPNMIPSSRASLPSVPLDILFSIFIGYYIESNKN